MKEEKEVYFQLLLEACRSVDHHGSVSTIIETANKLFEAWKQAK